MKPSQIGNSYNIFSPTPESLTLKSEFSLFCLPHVVKQQLSSSGGFGHGGDVRLGVYPGQHSQLVEQVEDETDPYARSLLPSPNLLLLLLHIDGQQV